MKNHKPWTITAKSSSEIEILLYEMIGQDFWTGEGTTAKSFAEDLKAAGDGIRKIHLRVNSPGGAVFDGLAIYNTLLSHGAKVTAQVDGLAASIASVIVMAASEISMGDNAIMMIHNPSTVVGGDANEMRKMADTLDKVKTSMITAYRRHTTKSVEEIGALCDEETWMTGQEAVDNGFAEKVTTPEGDDAADVAANFAPNFAPILAKFRKVPQQIAARFAGPAGAAPECKCDCFPCKADACPDCTNSACEDENCQDCPAQAAAKKAAAKKARAGKKAPVNPDICACACLPCSKENNCEDCSNAECADKNCEDCPAQASASARARAAASKCGCTCLPCSKENNCEDCANADCSDEACNDGACPMQAQAQAAEKKATEARWLGRLAGELGQSAALYATGTDELTRRLTATQALHIDIRSRVGAAEKLLSGLGSARIAEVTGAAKWTERVGADLEESSRLLASATAEIDRHSAADCAPIASSIAAIEAAKKALDVAKSERTAASTTLAHWTARVSAELDQSGKLLASIAEEIAGIARAAEERVAAAETEAANSRTLLLEMRQSQSAENLASAQWMERLAAELRPDPEAGLDPSEELLGLARSAGERAAEVSAEWAKAQANLEAERKSRLEEATGQQQWIERLHAEFSKLAELYAFAMEDLPRRAQAAVQRAQIAADRVANARAALMPAGVIQLLEAEHTTRSEEAAALTLWTEAKTAEFSAAAKLHTAAMEDLPRRAYSASARATQIQEEMANARPLIESGRKAIEEAVDAHLEGSERLSTSLRAARTRRDSVADELRRRAGAAEQSASSLSAAATELSPETAAKNQAAKEERAGILARVTGSLGEAAKQHSAAVDEIARRSRLAESAQENAGEHEITEHLEAAGKVLGELKKELSSKATGVGAVSPEFAKAAKLQAALAEDFRRRSRMAESSAEVGGEIGAQFEAVVSALTALVTALANTPALDPETTANLKKAAELYGSAVEEIARRARLASL